MALEKLRTTEVPIDYRLIVEEEPMIIEKIDGFFSASFGS